MEELWWNDKGELMTHAPSTYKIPVAQRRAGRVQRAHLRVGHNREDTIYRSKAVGEPPLMLAHLGVPCACATRSPPAWPTTRCRRELDAPATDERILASVEELKQRHARTQAAAKATETVS